MFAITRPDERAIERFLERAAESSPTYHPIGLSLLTPDEGFDVDQVRTQIGSGMAAFERACRAIDVWQPFKIGWVEAHPTASRPDLGTDVAVIARHFGFWSVNACRVTKRFPMAEDDPRYGFAYGTLSDHAECGEELFVVELDKSDGTVWYQIRAVSKPRALLARAGYPVTRRLQRRFRDGSVQAMALATEI